jgi:hypothetical protein
MQINHDCETPPLLPPLSANSAFIQCYERLRRLLEIPLNTANQSQSISKIAIVENGKVTWYMLSLLAQMTCHQGALLNNNQ